MVGELSLIARSKLSLPPLQVVNDHLNRLLLIAFVLELQLHSGVLLAVESDLVLQVFLLLKQPSLINQLLLISRTLTISKLNLKGKSLLLTRGSPFVKSLINLF